MGDAGFGAISVLAMLLGAAGGMIVDVRQPDQSVGVGYEVFNACGGWQGWNDTPQCAEVVDGLVQQALSRELTRLRDAESSPPDEDSMEGMFSSGFCIPDRTAPWQVRLAIYVSLRENVQYQTFDADHAVEVILQDRYPC